PTMPESPVPPWPGGARRESRRRRFPFAPSGGSAGAAGQVASPRATERPSFPTRNMMCAPLPAATPPAARDAVRALEASRIREIANAGMDRADIAAFWFGESDLPTPAFIGEAAAAALAGGD